MPDNQKTTVDISTNTIIKILLIGVLAVSLYVLRDLVLIVLTAIVLSSFVETAVKKFGRFGIGRTFSVLIVYLFSFLVLAAIFYLFVPVFVSELSSLVPRLALYFPTSDLLNTFQQATSGATGIFSQLFSGFSLDNLGASVKILISGASGGFFQALSLTFGGLTNLILIVVITFLLSVQENGIENFLRIIISPKHEEYIIDLWERAQRKIGLWFQGQLLLGVIVGVLIFLGLSIFGVKYALSLALITALSELIPFGILLAMAVAIFFSYTDAGISQAAIVAGFYLITHQFEAYLIAPLIVKKVIGISPLIVILSILIGIQLAGFWGLVLAIPTAVVILEYVHDVQKRKVSAKLN